MPDQKAARGPIPRWAWLFALVCFAIPVLSIGGAIPSAIGVGGSFYCLAVARETKKTERRRLIHCASVTAVCWALFAALVGGVTAARSNSPGFLRTSLTTQDAQTQGNSPSSVGRHTPEPVIALADDEGKRQEIYAMAMSMRDKVARATARRSELRSQGTSVRVATKQLEHVKGMHENRQEFATRFYKITREQLDEIIAEGDRKRWPTE